MNKSKRLKDLVSKIEKKPYSVDEATKLVIESALEKFDASIELHIRLGIDPKQSDQNVRGTVSLPHGTGKEKRVAVFVADEKKKKEAKDAGADVIGGEELVEKIKETEKCDFEVAIAEPAMMKHVGKIGKVLGVKGLMPNPKTETVTDDIAKAVKEQKSGKTAFKMDASGNVHQVIGKKSFKPEQIKENLEIFVEAVKKVRPDGVKGEYIKKVSLSSTMGPGIVVNI
ncbi:MAG: 50S ribosomal protein L1 [bacterium]